MNCLLLCAHHQVVVVQDELLGQLQADATGCAGHKRQTFSFCHAPELPTGLLANLPVLTIARPRTSPIRMRRVPLINGLKGFRFADGRHPDILIRTSSGS
jgi:hypothetical protein